MTSIGGQLDVVVSRRDESCPVVTTNEAGLSDHTILNRPVQQIDDGGRRTGSIQVGVYNAALTYRKRILTLHVRSFRPISNLSVISKLLHGAAR